MHCERRPTPTCFSSLSDKEAILDLISFHYGRADLVSGAAMGILIRPTRMLPNCTTDTNSPLEKKKKSVNTP